MIGRLQYDKFLVFGLILLYFPSLLMSLFVSLQDTMVIKKRLQGRKIRPVSAFISEISDIYTISKFSCTTLT